MAVPDTLQQRLNLFEKTGQIFKKEDELFRVDSWTQVMIGQGLNPESFHLATHQMPEPELKDFLMGYHKGIQKYVASLPSQESFIAKYCKSQ